MIYLFTSFPICWFKFWLVDLSFFKFCSTFNWPICMHPANNGVSWYPSYQKIFELAENFEQIYPTLSKLQNNLWFSSISYRIFQHFLPNNSKWFRSDNIFLKSYRKFDIKSCTSQKICQFHQDTRKVRIICRSCQY